MSRAFFDRRENAGHRLYCHVGHVHADCSKERHATGRPDHEVQHLRARSQSLNRDDQHSREAGQSPGSGVIPCDEERGPGHHVGLDVRPEAGQSPSREAGQSLVESTFVLLIFFVLLFGVIDCGQVLVAHQSLVERVRGGVRWGVVRPFDGTGDQIANLVLYNQPEEPRAAKEGFLGLSRENVQVRYRPATAERPDDETLSVAIVNYRYHFLSPWAGKALVNPRPVLMSAPMAFRTADLTAKAPASHF